MKKNNVSRKLTRRQIVLAAKEQNKGNASNIPPTKQHIRHVLQTTFEIPPCASSPAISRPSDPPRTSDTAVGEKDQNNGKDSRGYPMKQNTTGPAQMTSQIPPCASSHAISRPSYPPSRTSDVKPPRSIQGAISPRTSHPKNSDAGHTLRSFVALETQNNDGKPVIYLNGHGFLPSRPAANEIEDILKSHYTDPWPSWKKIPISTTDLWFEEFLKKFSICPADYDWAKRNFEMQGAAMMKNILNDARTTMNKPNWIKDGDWERLCEHWKSEELKKSLRQRKDNTWVDIQNEFAHTLDHLTKSAFAQRKPLPSESEMAGKHGLDSSVEWVKRQEFDELNKKMEEIRNESDKLRTRVANMERLAEHNNALIQELMENMNMPPTVEESQDEDEIDSQSEP